MYLKSTLTNILYASIITILLPGMIAFATPVASAHKQGDIVTIKLATTTSLDNSGLLGYLLPIFTGETGIAVDVIAVGTGAAIELGKAGDVDVVLVHAPAAEEQFIEDGYGVARHYICQNEFVIVGHEADPVGIANADGVVQALEMIRDAEAPFVSRGDESGTHKREQSLWAAAEITPEGEWYISAGQGMGAVLTMSSEMQAYTLTDTGTFYSMEDNLDLVVLVSGDELLENIYSIIPLNPELHPDLKHDEVGVLVNWITSPEAADLINEFKVNGHVLFEVR